MSQPADITLRFAALMQELGVAADEPVVVAVSGGADSMALALLVTNWSQCPDKNHYVTVDHGIRGKQSAQEAQMVAQWLASRGLNHQIITLHETAPKSDLQAWARDQRYQVMEQFCQQQKVPYLLLAHHRDDQAETVLMRLMRGSGVDGLSAMTKRQEVGERVLSDGVTKVLRLRPMLSCHKEELVAYLKDLNQPWVDDPSNQNDHYNRVAVRQFLCEQSESADISKRLFETAERFQRVKKLLDRLVDDFFIHHSILHPEGWVEFDLDEFKKLDEELALRVLTRLCRSVGGQVYPPRLNKSTFLWRQMIAADFQGSTLSGAKFQLAKPRFNAGALEGQNLCVQVVREVGRLDAQRSLDDDNGAMPFMWDNRFLCVLKQGLSDDLRIAALGQKGRILLKDRFDEKDDVWSLPHNVLEALPAVWQGEALLEVGLVERGVILESVKFAPLNLLIKGSNR